MEHKMLVPYIKKLYKEFHAPHDAALTMEQEQKRREVFDYADSDRRGSVDFEKVKKLLITIGEEVDEAGIKDWVKHNSNGKEEVTWYDL